MASIVECRATLLAKWEVGVHCVEVRTGEDTTQVRGFSPADKPCFPPGAARRSKGKESFSKNLVRLGWR